MAAEEEQKMNVVIVGAGLTGLILGNRLKERASKNDQILLIEKSRGVGGRMATRRTENAKFDHGAQFYARRDPLEPFHHLWSSESLSQFWFERNGVQHFSSSAGMTALAKRLGKDLKILLEKRVASIERQDSGNQVKLETGESFDYDRLILTSPLPQSLEILRSSDVEYDVALNNISYSKALVGLLEMESSSKILEGSTGYSEFEQGLLFSISSQTKKRVSENPAYTVTLSAEASEANYASSDEEIAKLIEREICQSDSKAVVKKIQIKRWLYNKPLSTYGALFCKVNPSVFLAGDAFGGASLNGAARSAHALAEHLFSEEAL